MSRSSISVIQSACKIVHSAASNVRFCFVKIPLVHSFHESRAGSKEPFFRLNRTDGAVIFVCD